MKKISQRFTFLALLSCLLVLTPQIGTAGVDLPWSTTFNCSDWLQTGNNPPTCDGINIGSGYLCSNTVGSQINVSGNMPTGGGGKGFRLSLGDGKNNQAANAAVAFNVPQPEVWMRLYKREPVGFVLNGLQALKLFSINTSIGGATAYVYELGDGNGQGGGLGLYKQYGTGSGVWHYPGHAYCDHASGLPEYGWQHIWGGPTGDGRFHSYEVHLKTNSAPGVADGIVQVWVDGVLYNDHRDINWDTALFTGINPHVNDDSPYNGGCVYVDFDDYAVTNITLS